jgi:hypothetical protein
MLFPPLYSYYTLFTRYKASDFSIQRAETMLLYRENMHLFQLSYYYTIALHKYVMYDGFSEEHIDSLNSQPPECFPPRNRASP